ncbi:transcriptional regulator family: Fungal Specific TF [Paecilomyces variotii]|nr:transcriptional regulator family: Fungal Specific TF [Paecilomyces variotii]
MHLSRIMNDDGRRQQQRRHSSQSLRCSAPPPQRTIPSSLSPSAESALPKASSGRAARACEPCRQRKARCSGTEPMCAQCEALKLKCTYTGGKRERDRIHLQSLLNAVKDYEDVLRDMLPRVSYEDAQRIRFALTQHAGVAEETRNPFS